MKYLMWGIGERLKKNIHKLDTSGIIAFVDKKAANSESKFLGKPLIIPDDISRYEFDFIVISSNQYFEEISRVCIILWGVDCRKILRLDYLLAYECHNFYGYDMQIGYHNIKKYSDDWKTASVVRNWMGNDPFDVSNTNEVINWKGYLYHIFLEKATICIYQVSHKKFTPIGNRGYAVIGVGDDISGYLNDKTGDNIAKFNKKINECTALYWMWKNSETEYIGLNHYRRVFESEFNIGWPLQDVEALLLLLKFDVIVAQAVVFHDNSVKSMLSKEICQEAFEVSWKELVNIFEKKNPEDKDAFKRVMEGNIIFPCNMFIMDREKVNEYCDWIFPILFELIDRVEIKEEWDAYSKRVLGFWAERLFTVWLYLCGYRVKELPILLTDNCSSYGK